MRTYVFDYMGFRLTGEYEYEPAERATRNEPGYDAIVTVCSVHIDGSDKDAIELVDPAVVHAIEASVLEGCAADYEDYLVSQAEARREDMALGLI